MSPNACVRWCTKGLNEEALRALEAGRKGNRERIEEIGEKLVKALYMHVHNSHTIQERLI